MHRHATCWASAYVCVTCTGSLTKACDYPETRRSRTVGWRRPLRAAAFYRRSLNVWNDKQVFSSDCVCNMSATATSSDYHDCVELKLLPANDNRLFVLFVIRWFSLINFWSVVGKKRSIFPPKNCWTQNVFPLFRGGSLSRLAHWFASHSAPFVIKREA